jgi:hypothetical protein
LHSSHQEIHAHNAGVIANTPFETNLFGIQIKILDRKTFFPPNFMLVQYNIIVNKVNEIIENWISDFVLLNFKNVVIARLKHGKFKTVSEAMLSDIRFKIKCNSPLYIVFWHCN